MVGLLLMEFFEANNWNTETPKCWSRVISQFIIQWGM